MTPTLTFAKINKASIILPPPELNFINQQKIIVGEGINYTYYIVCHCENTSISTNIRGRKTAKSRKNMEI